METPVKSEDVDPFMQMVSLPCNDNARENDNFEQYDHQLAALGIVGYPLALKENDKPTLSNVFRRVMICLADYQKRIEERDETIQRLSRELNDSRLFENRLRDALERVQREIKAITEKERHSTEKLREMEAAYAKEKNEVTKLTRKNNDMMSHGTAVASRKECELEQKCEKLKGMLRDSRTNNPPGIKMANVLSRQDGSRGTWNTDAMTQKRKTDILESAKASLLERNAQICNENVLLKHALETVLLEMGKLAISEENEVARPVVEDDGHQDNRFAKSVRVTLNSRQYFDGDDLESMLSIFCEKLEEIKLTLQLPIHQPEEAPVLQLEKIRLEEELASLKEELERREKVIQHQEKLLDAAVQVDNMENSYLKGGFILEDQEKFQQERNFFLEQRSNFERERRSFTEAAVRLAREKREFDEQRYNILKLHSISLETPPRKPKMVARAEHELNRSLPTTPELYQVLGLSTVE